jgi:hypothetical protein
LSSGEKKRPSPASYVKTFASGAWYSKPQPLRRLDPDGAGLALRRREAGGRVDLREGGGVRGTVRVEPGRLRQERGRVVGMAAWAGAAAGVAGGGVVCARAPGAAAATPKPSASAMRAVEALIRLTSCVCVSCSSGSRAVSAGSAAAAP